MPCHTQVPCQWVHLSVSKCCLPTTSGMNLNDELTQFGWRLGRNLALPSGAHISPCNCLVSGQSAAQALTANHKTGPAFLHQV